MLGMKTYSQDYIDACRARVDVDLRAYRKQAGKLPGWPNSAGASIKLPPDKSLLKLKVGDDVKLSEADFVRLSKAFFAEIEKKYL